MVSDWSELTLGEIAQNISRPFKFKDFEDVTFINTGDVLEGQFLHSNTVSKIGLPGQAKKEIQKGDILFSEIRPANKRFALVDFDPTGYVVSTKFMVIKKISEDIDDRFFYILLTNKITLHEFQRIAESRSGTFPQITFDAIAYFPVKIPPLTEQKAIAHILGSLDDKIELNRQMNATLEAMAQALFKSWFVDFDPVIDNALAAGNAIPDEFIERAEQRKTIEKKDNSDIQGLFPDAFELTEEMGWIPKGWGVKKISDLLESVSITYPLKAVNEVIFLNTGDILAGKFLHKNYSDASSLPGQAKKSIKRDDILYSEIRPKNKRYAYVNFEADDYVVSTKLMVLRSVSCVKSLFSYFYLKQESVVSDLQYMAEDRSGTFPQITFDVLSQLTLTLPNETALVDYFTDQVLVPYHNKIYKNEESSEKLAEFRDTLLPKLMSGELRILDAEALVEDI